VVHTDSDPGEEARKAADNSISAGNIGEGYARTLEELRLRREGLQSIGRRCELDDSVLLALGRAGALAMDLGDPEAARSHLALEEKGKAIVRRADPGSSSDSIWEASRNRLGRLALLKGDAAGAARIFSATLESRRRRLSRDPEPGVGHYGIAATLSFLAEARIGLGQPEDAKRLTAEAISILDKLFPEPPFRDLALLETARALVVSHQAHGGEGEALARARQVPGDPSPAGRLLETSREPMARDVRGRNADSAGGRNGGVKQEGPETVPP
jgi:hypothetical protein